MIPITTVTFNSSGTFNVPAGVVSLDCQCWGEGGTGGTAIGGTHSGAGGGGGEFAEETTLAVTAGSNYTYTIGTGGTATSTTFPGDAVTVTANYGHTASGSSSGVAGSGSTNSIHHNGGAGGAGIATANRGGGGGGSSAGTGSAGNNGTAGGAGGNSAGGSAPTGGGAGGQGGTPSGSGVQAGSVPGGGGGGGGTNGSEHGAAGAAGQVTLIYSATVNQTASLAAAGTLTAAGGALAAASLTGVGTLLALRAGAANASLSGVGTLTANATLRSAAVALSGVGTLSAFGAAPAPAVVNQWGYGYFQGGSFNNTNPVLQSVAIPLDPASSVGGGSGVSTAGNWLFVISSWTQDPSIAETHIGVGDDVHSWWREFPASNIAGLTRTSVSYTPNIARQVSNVYVAPDNEVAAINVLVVEISGLGPWDTVVGTNSNYAAAATSLSLTHTAGVQSFFIAGVGGDNTSSGQAFAPAGWTTLATQTQTNGTDHTTDNILTSAFLASTSSTQSVSASASSENLSGFLLAVRVTGTDPVPVNQNPNWPYLLFEAAFGGGFNTPNSELTWTDISSRLWSYDETTGIQFQLGQLQATNLELELDNFDNALASQNTASPYYPNVTSGTPLRIRAAIGTIAGVTANRWYVIQRNAQEWPEAIDEAFRRNAPATGTDVWAALSSTGPTPYRGEVYADSPYAWWPCDDQPGSGGVLPTILLNAALGNDNPLNILVSPLGAVAQTASPGGAPEGSFTPANSASYAVGADSGWMYGDPVSTPASALAGNSITASPGAAAWQQTGELGTTGSYGWFLSVNDASFPVLADGVTVEGWFNYGFYGSAEGFGNDLFGVSNYGGQPATAMTLIEMATSSNPVAVLQLDTSGHLNLITYNGSTGTSHSVYSSSDLRSQGWFQVTMTLTTTAWTVWLDAGDLAKTSGSATGMTSAWTWLLANADMGAGGGGQTSGIVHGANVSLSHLAVYPCILPNWRIQAHYWAAVTGFGLIPATGAPSISAVSNPALTSTEVQFAYTPDGSAYGGSYGTGSVSVLAALIVANAGGFTSGPSAWGQAAITGTYNSSSRTYSGAAAFTTWQGLATTFGVYTSSQVAAGNQAVVVQGQSVTFESGYGSGASYTGPGVISDGSGGSPPTAASAIGDSVANRIERALGYANVNYPGRCIDAAPDLVQAGLDLGGQQGGQNVQNIAISDGGLLFIDNAGKLNYWQRPHLAAQYTAPVWQIGPTTSAGRIPYDRQIQWILDPQRAWNAIEIQPYSPTGAQLPIITPANGSAVTTSQKQFGAQPFQVNSYLQQTSEMQNQANWIFQFFGQPVRRAEKVKIDAATYPQAWTLVLGVNVGDVIQIEDWQIGGGGGVFTYRVTEIKRTFRFGDGESGGDMAASIELTCDYEPSSYWT